MGEQRRHGLDLEIYKKNPETGEESEHVYRRLEADGPLPPARLLPACECGDAACVKRGGRP